MSVIASRPEAARVAAWALFAGATDYLTFAPPDKEAFPFALVWATLALLSALRPWPQRATIISFVIGTTATGVALVRYLIADAIAWQEFSEVILMATTLSMLIWLIYRQRAAQVRLRALQRTAQVRLRALQQAHRQLSETRANVALFGSHEIRTRLTIARGYSQLIADQSVEPRVREDAALVVAELIKASALAANLLTLDHVMEPPILEPVDIDRLLMECLQRWSVTADRSWSARSDVGVVANDHARLEVILDCLLENAVRFTGPGSSIAITADAVDGELVLAVQDAGHGIPTADLEIVFETFRTSSTAGELAGSGLGLAIVKATTAACGGTVSVASVLGQGTTFTLRFPLTPGQASPIGDVVSDRGTAPSSITVS